MTLKSLSKTFVALAAFAALSAHAEGLYIGGSLGSSHYKGGGISPSADRSDTGGKIYGGYGFTPNFAVEAGYADFGSAGDMDGHGIYVDLVGSYPIAAGFSALGRVGVFNGRAEQSNGDSDSGTNAKIGLGVQYDLSPQTGIRAEWERYRFDTFNRDSDTDMYSIGVNYKF